VSEIAAMRVEPPEFPKNRSYLFVATPDEIAEMDLVIGPCRPMRPGKRGKRAVPLTECSIPGCSHPSFYDAMIGAVLQDANAAKLEQIRSDGKHVLYRFPPAVTDILSTLTPDKPGFSLEVIHAVAERMIQTSNVLEHYQPSGVSGAVMIVRCDALKAVPRGGGKELFCWYRFEEG
jgi:hypothetical protein